MIILDTDHFTVLRFADDSRYPILTQRLLASEDQRIVTTVVTVEEQMRGWLKVNYRIGDRLVSGKAQPAARCHLSTKVLIWRCFKVIERLYSQKEVRYEG
jgi:hypothetical protein